MEGLYYTAPQNFEVNGTSTFWNAMEGPFMELTNFGMPYPFSYPVWNVVEGTHVAVSNVETCGMYPVWNVTGPYMALPDVGAHYATCDPSCSIWPTLAIPTVLLTLAKFKKSKTYPSVYRSKFKEICEKFASSVHIYTDGTEKEGRSAAAAISTDGESRTRRLQDGSTSNDAELSALLLALDIVDCSNFKRFVIFSDCLSGMQVLASRKLHNPLVVDIVKRLTTVTEKGCEVVFCWVPSHVGIAGNEKVDEIVKRVV